MSTERIIVVKSVAAQFRQALAKTAQNMTGMSGPSAMAATITKVQSLVDDALSKGAKLEFGKNEIKNGNQQHLSQMIVSNVNSNMDIYHTETFGPVSALIEVDDLEEAIRVANDTEYGLS